MRAIDDRALEGMTSPVRHIFKYLHRAIFSISPERDSEFENELNDFRLTYLDTHKWVLNVNVEQKHVKISRRVVELLWCASYAYFIIYNDVVRHQPLNENGEILLAKIPVTKEAVLLLQWAFEVFLNKEDSDWPDKLPMPIENPESESNHHVADELCLGALAFMLHHEFSHMRFKHPVGSLENERNADYGAAEWIFGKCWDEDTKEFRKRGLCVATALGVLLGVSIHTGQFQSQNYPPAYDRVINTLKRHITDEHHLVWAFVSTIFSLHMSNSSCPPNSKEINKSFYDSAQAMADQLSQL